MNFEEFLLDNPFTAGAVLFFERFLDDPDKIKKAVIFVCLVVFLRVAIAIATAIIKRLRIRNQGKYSRTFSFDQKSRVFANANWQCEFDDGLRRCRNKAEHADHFYPWARGGASSERNLVAACSKHNLSKGAKMPSPALKFRIENRRRSYFPKGADVTAGEWSNNRSNYSAA